MLMRLVSYASVGVLAFAVGLGGGYLWQQYSKPSLQLQRATQLGEAARLLPDFQLEYKHKRPFTREHFKGRWTLLFFGYTNCPDICPLTLTELRGLFKRLEGTPYRQDTQVIFVSVDPKRDALDLLDRYVQHFHPEFLGVTGSQEELDRLTRALGIVYSLHAEDDHDHYLVDHSASMLLIDPEARLYATFSAPHNAELLAQDYIALRNAAS